MLRYYPLVIAVLLLMLFAQISDSRTQPQSHRLLNDVIGSGSSIRKQDYCDLFKNAPNEDLKVNSSAILSLPAAGPARVDGGGEIIVYSDDCNGRDYFGLAIVKRDKDVKLVQNLIASNAHKNVTRLARINFVGKFDIQVIPAFGHLGWLRARVEIDDIKEISLLGNRFPMPDHDAKAPIIEAGEFLQAINSEVVLTAFRRGMSKYDFQALTPENAEMSVNGKVISNSDFPGSLVDAKTGQLSLVIDSVSRINEVWRIRGSVTRQLGDRASEQFTYVIEYLPNVNGLWSIKTITFERSKIKSPTPSTLLPKNPNGKVFNPTVVLCKPVCVT